MRNQKIIFIQSCLISYVIKLLALKVTGQYVLKTFLNDKKIPCIPRVFFDNKFVIDFKEKAELFNLFFTEQCSLPKNNNKVPNNLLFLTEKRFSNVQVSNENIIKMINNLDPIKNYRPVSLLSICSKIFQIILFNELYKFSNESDLLSSIQSCFGPCDSCINQLLSITHKIYQSFDNDLKVKGVFLDILKAFDKVWHEGLILKLSRNGISGNLLYLLKDFLKYRKHRVVLNGQNSSWKGINSSVLQGSILGPLLFLIYLNDLPDGFSFDCKLFADDTSL